MFINGGMNFFFVELDFVDDGDCGCIKELIV